MKCEKRRRMEYFVCFHNRKEIEPENYFSFLQEEEEEKCNKIFIGFRCEENKRMEKCSEFLFSLLPLYFTLQCAGGEIE